MLSWEIHGKRYIVMKAALSKISVLVAAFGLVSASAFAGVVETNTDRFNYALVGLDNDSDGPHTTTGPSIYGNFTDTTTATASDFSGDATGTADQISDVAPASYSATLDAFAFLDYDGFGFGSSDATSEFNVAFTITSPMTFSIDGVAETTGTGSGVFISLVNTGGGGTPTQSIVNISLGDNNVNIDVDGSLLPGDYELRAQATAGHSAVFESFTGTTTASAQFAMLVTPEPTAAAFLVMGALVGLRRRRAK